MGKILQTVLITGAAGGIGAGLVTAFGKAGWTVVATSRRGENGAVAGDLDAIATDDAARDAFVGAVRDRLDGAPLSCLVNNAAMQVLGGTETVSGAQMMRSFAVNALAPFRLVQAFLPDLRRTRGSVLNIGTVHAQATKPGFVAYATTKTAMHGLTRGLAVDLGPEVRVNTLAPAATRTPMLEAGFAEIPEAFAQLAGAHPLGRIAEVDEIARTALWLCGEGASFMTGATVYADGGVLSRLHDPL